MTSEIAVEICPSCDGSALEYYAAVPCGLCNGHGTVVIKPQTRARSLTESLTNTGIGLVISMVTWRFVAWLYSIPTSNGQTIGITAIFTVVSIMRGYFIRRWFNRRV